MLNSARHVVIAIALLTLASSSASAASPASGEATAPASGFVVDEAGEMVVSGMTSYEPFATVTTLDGFNPGANGGINAVALQSDGKIIVGGDFSRLGGGGSGNPVRNRLGRLNPDGSLDTTFNPGANESIRAVAVQADGKIVVGGLFTMLGGGGTGTTSRNFIARLNSDGSLDTSFNPGANASVGALTIQADGRILVGGNFTMMGGGGTGTTSRNFIARLNADGSLDTGFNPGANNLVGTITLQHDLKILVGGTFTMLGGGGTGTTVRNRIGRLNTDGSLDAAFDPGADFLVGALAVQADGKILVGGLFATLGGGGTGTTARSDIGRLHSDGSIDTSFNPGANNFVNDIIVRPDGKIVVAGSFTTLGGGGSGSTTRNKLGLLNPDGTVDSRFNPGASYTSPSFPTVLSLAVQSDGKVLVAGAFDQLGGGTGTTIRNNIGRLHDDGALDTEFNPGSNSFVDTVALHADGRVLVGGAFTLIGGGGLGQTARNRIARLDSDGTVEPTFNPNANGRVNAVLVQPDGKIVIGGEFTTIGVTTRNRIARLNIDGSLDTGFNPGAGSLPGDSVLALALQPDGKILVAGSFLTLGGATRNGIGRLNADGSLDSSFDPLANNLVMAVALQSDGKIVVGGPFTMFGTTTRNRIARLNADGSLDAGFDPGANDFVFTIAIQADGKILIGGNFITVGLSGRNRIARLDADGSLDAGFNPGANATVRSLAVQADGKILVGGVFTTLAGASRVDLGRLNSDGTIDTAYNPGPAGQVEAMAIQPDAKAVMVGLFSGFANLSVSRNRIARVPDTAAFQTLAVTAGGTVVSWTRSGGAPEVARVTFEQSTDGTTYSSIGNGTRITGGWQLTGLTLPTNQNVYVRARGFYPTGYHNGSGSIAESIRNAYVSCAAISPTTLAAGTAGAAYLQAFSSSGGFGTVTFSQSGTLPVGMNFSNGVLSGTPTQTGSFPITVRATDSHSGCVSAQTLTLTINCPTITLSPSALPSGAMGVAYTPTSITQSGGIGAATFGVTSGALPSGMTLSSAGGLSGTPTNGGTFNFTVTATDANLCQGSRAYTLTITCSYALSPSTRDVTAGGGSVNLNLVTGASCTWTASSNVPWLHPTPNGTGSGTIAVTIDANKTGVARTGQITVEGQTATFTQLGATVTATTSGINPALSGNARYLAFEAEDGTLVPGDVNGARDVFVRDRTTDAVVRVSVTTSGEAANGASFAPALNFTGRYVVFESDATNLTAGDTNGFRDVFLRDRDADGNGIFDEPGGVSTLLISQSASGSPGRGASVAPAISADGAFVVFASDASNLIFFDTNGVRDVFVREQPTSATGQLVRVSLGVGDIAADGASNRPSISTDGRYVAFESDATNLVAADTNAVGDVFVRDRTGGTTSRVSVGADGSQATARSFAPAMASDGGLVVFTSDAALVPADTNALPDVYAHPPASGVTTRVSVGLTDLQAVGSSVSPAVSADGRYVAFASTASNLSPLDTNGVEDVYVRDRTTGQVRLILFGNQVGNGRSFDPSISADGLSVGFSTEATLPALTSLFGNGTQPGPQAAVDAPAPVMQLSPNHGPANTAMSVLMTGPNMKAISSVSFGTITVTPSFVGDALLVTAPPQPAGTVDVTVVTGVVQGLRVSSFTYDAPEEQKPDCAFTLALDSGQSAHFSADGGSSTARVTAPAGCTWTPVTSVVGEWITATPAVPAPVDGTAAVTVHSLPNTNPNARSGAVMVAGQTLTFNQDGQGCTYTVDQPASGKREVPAGAGTDQGVHITTGPGCQWTATSGATWLQVSSGAGSATVAFTVAANTTDFDRTTTLTVQGTAIVVTQLAVVSTSCTYALTPPATLGAGEGTTEIGLTTAPTASNCPWNARSEADWLTVQAPISGTTAARIVVKASANSGGTRQGTVDVAGQKVTVVQQGIKANFPFGIVDTPAQNATGLAGSIPLTGWALDDKGVVAVEIYRETVPGEPGGARCRPNDPTSANCLFIGDAVFVRGSRPDVQALYPSMPNSDRAGWGYLLLSNQLPNQGNGTFRLVFLARDTDNTIDPATGTLPELDRRTVSFTNSTAVTPFGGIDTPAQGATIQGTVYNNFGWALTPLSKTIPKTGATINVFVDSVRIGSPVYDLPRSDIATLFPNFNNSSGPIGLMTFDTTVIADGVHTIAWVVTDDAGAAEGIGSRFFRVQNGAASMIAAPPSFAFAATEDVTTLPLSKAPVLVGHGFDSRPVAPARQDRTGTRHVIVRALDVVRLDLGGGTGMAYEGHTQDVTGLTPLPAGSTFDAGAGTFAWQLGPGLVGAYDLLFVRTVDGVRERIPVRMVVEPYERAVAAPIVVDPLVRDPAVPFRITGSATSGAARQIREVVIYAYPADGGAPLLVGHTSVPGVRPDTGAAFGGQFARSDFGIDLRDLSPGTYDLLVVARSAIAADLDGAIWVRAVTVQ